MYSRDRTAAALSPFALDDLLSITPVGVVVAEAPGGRVLHINEQAARLTGTSREGSMAVAKEDYPRLIDARDLEGNRIELERLPLSRALAGETVRDEELVIRLPGGGERTVLVSATPLRDAHGAPPTAAVAVFFDVSERVRLEGELRHQSGQTDAAVEVATRRVEELQALREVGRAMVSVLDQERLLDLVVEQALELTGASGGLIARAEWDDAVLRVQPARGTLAPMDGEGFPLRGSLVELVILDGAPLVANDLEAMPRDSVVRTVARRLGLSNILLVPMQVFGESYGVLGVVDREGGFGVDQRRALEGFADYAALALHNAQLYAAERRRAEENRALLGAAEALTSTLDPDEILERIVELARELVGADGAGVTVVEEVERSRVRISVATGLLRPLHGVSVPLAGTLTEAIIAAASPRTFEVGERGQLPSVARLADLEVGYLAALPLTVGEEAFGVLAVAKRRQSGRFGERDLRVLSLLASQAALSVRNSRLFVATEAASRAKSEFLAIMSHELRTPLNALEGYASLLEEGVYGELNPEQHHALDRMRASRRHLLALIEQVLDVTRADAGRPDLRLETIDLGELVAEIGEALRGAAEARGLRLEVEPCAGAHVTSDPAMVRQIVTNLVGNAIKFTDAGRISLACESRRGGASVRVEDTGAGIPADALERIFEPFVQLDASTTRREGGSGLGLALSRKFARMLGGDIEVESRTEGEGRGSRFTLRLPASPD